MRLVLQVWRKLKFDSCHGVERIKTHGNHYDVALNDERTSGITEYLRPSILKFSKFLQMKS